jgi:hypothetical protein
MSTIDHVFDVFRRVNPLRGRGSAGTQADRERGQQMRGKPFTQTDAEQAGTRQRMEAELDVQRLHRSEAAASQVQPAASDGSTHVAG